MRAGDWVAVEEHKVKDTELFEIRKALRQAEEKAREALEREHELV